MPAKCKRILMLLENSSYPSDPRVRREALTLVAAGYEVTVISPLRRDGSWRTVIDGVHVYRFRAPREGDGLFGYLWEYGYSLVATFLLSIVAYFREGFDVIHAHNPPDLFVFIAMFYRLLGVRFVFDHHDLAPEMYLARLPGQGNRIVFRALLFFEKLTCWMADHVIATNESYKAVEMDRGKVPEDRITVVRNGPDLNQIFLVDPDPALRAKASTILGYVGVIGVQDGLDYLVRALSHLANDFGRRDFYCWVLGGGPALENVKQLTAELGMDDHIGFTGFVPIQEVVRYLSSADICVGPDPRNPYTDRSTMVKMTEYMALSKPIVVFDLTEHRATADGAALYAQPNSELDFAKQIARLMDDPALRKQLGEHGQKLVEEQLAWHHQAKQLLAAYATLNGIPQQPSAPTETEMPPAKKDPVHIG